jgi:lysozyme family protein
MQKVKEEYQRDWALFKMLKNWLSKCKRNIKDILIRLHNSILMKMIVYLKKKEIHIN